MGKPASRPNSAQKKAIGWWAEKTDMNQYVLDNPDIHQAISEAEVTLNVCDNC